MGKNSLAHTKWNCKYHVVCAPKFRRKVIYNQLKEDKLQNDLSSKGYVDPFTGKRVRNLCYLNSNPGNVVHAMNNSERNLARPVG